MERFSFTEIFEFFSLYLQRVTRPKRRYGGDAALTWETEEGVRPPASAFKFPIPSPLPSPLPSGSVPLHFRIPSLSKAADGTPSPVYLRSFSTATFPLRFRSDKTCWISISSEAKAEA